MNLKEFEDAILDPNVFVVLGRRGYRLNWLADALSAHDLLCVPVTRPALFVAYSPNDPVYAGKLAQHMERWCVKEAPLLRTRVFMEAEQWARVRGTRTFRHLEKRVYTMPKPYLDEPLERDTRVLDAWGNMVVAASAARIFVYEQPEERFLVCSVSSTSPKTQVAVMQRNFLAVAEIMPESWLKRQPWVTFPQFLQHCETIGVGRRVKGAAWKWAPLWRYGLLEAQKETA